TVRKEGDFLRHSILEDFDFLFGQVIEESAARIAGGERDVYQPDINPDGFLPQGTRAETKERGKDENAGFVASQEFLEGLADTHIAGIRWILHEGSLDQERDQPVPYVFAGFETWMCLTGDGMNRLSSVLEFDT